ncbi:MAG TPA: phosphotransferase [Chloroflexia bacterium]|nr:phosphotransferase [Chloroflexia bacterium]
MRGPEQVGLLERLAQEIIPESKLLRAWPLKGGVSAQVTALEVREPDGSTTRLVVREHGNADRARNPNIAADEFKLLKMLKSAGLPVPEPLYLGAAGEISESPFIVVAFIDSDTASAPTDQDALTREVAAQLARIHAVDISTLDPSFLPEQEELIALKLQHHPSKLDESLQEGRIRDLLEPVWPLPHRNRAVLLHGDFWPGNLLWREDQLVGIIDWEDAALGDPLADVANTRLELLWALGSEAMQSFTRHYAVLTRVDFTDLPYWDLYAALRPASRLSSWGLDAVTTERFQERHRLFTAQAIRRLPTTT